MTCFGTHNKYKCPKRFNHLETHQNTFTDTLLFAANALETDKGATNQTERGVFWHFFAGSAGLPVIVLEDDIVVVGELQEAGRGPLRLLDEQGLQGRKETEVRKIF